jgi:alkylhydroperoxidase/carboxymuconolactone decarboxylase family protein YurZ
VEQKTHSPEDDLAPLNGSTSAVAPEFAKLTQHLLFDDIWKRPGLSQRDKSLITVTCLVALNRIEHVEFHLKKAFENRSRFSRQSRFSRSPEDQLDSSS